MLDSVVCPIGINIGAESPEEIAIAVTAQILSLSKGVSPEDREALAYKRAAEICDEDVAVCHGIGQNGLKIIKELVERGDSSRPLNILTHCNAGWLATVDWGTALAPIYMAHDLGINLHVWVDETKPRNQGFNLTAWELINENIDCSEFCES